MAVSSTNHLWEKIFLIYLQEPTSQNQNPHVTAIRDENQYGRYPMKKQG